MRKKPKDLFFSINMWLSTGITLCILLFIIGHVFVNGIAYIKPSLFEFTYNSENVSLLPALITTLFTVVLALLLAVPFGVFTAIYLTEYAKRGSKLIKVVRITTETLSGIPSIVYGLFGLLFFVTYLKWGYSLIAGSCTLAIMILPVIIRTTEESLKAVPDSYREGAFALGAGRLRTVFKIILPSAMPGILAGIIVSVGRCVGETAALIYTAGTATKIPKSIFESGRTLSIHMWALSSEGLYTGQAYATAIILLVVVIAINALSRFLSRKLTRGEQ